MYSISWLQRRAVQVRRGAAARKLTRLFTVAALLVAAAAASGCGEDSVLLLTLKGESCR